MFGTDPKETLENGTRSRGKSWVETVSQVDQSCRFSSRRGRGNSGEQNGEAPAGAIPDELHHLSAGQSADQETIEGIDRGGNNGERSCCMAMDELPGAGEVVVEMLRQCRTQGLGHTYIVGVNKA